MIPEVTVYLRDYASHLDAYGIVVYGVTDWDIIINVNSQSEID